MGYTYYLRSSVLGGEIVAEIAGNGQKIKGYVLETNGDVMALQSFGSYGSEYILWMNEDPLGQSVRATDSTGSFENHYSLKYNAELDPVKSNAEREDPYLNQEPYTPPDENNPEPTAYGNSTRPTRGCVFNGMPIPDCNAYIDQLSAFDLLAADARRSTERYRLRQVGTLSIRSIGGAEDDYENAIVRTNDAGTTYPLYALSRTSMFASSSLTMALEISASRVPQDPGPTPAPNPNCIANAVAGATGLARPFGNVGPTGSIGHDGIHVISPVGSTVRTLGVLAGTVLGRPHAQGDGLYAVDVLVPGVGVAIYKDLATVNVHAGQRLRAGTLIGTVGEGGDYAGLHFALLSGGRNEDKYYRGLTSRAAAGDLSAVGQIKASMFINPNGPNSPVRCPGVPVNAAGVNSHP
jgi:murein DD-endopeptidase MepM/ murein hydrolase activator NlpD